ncbi:MAG: DUF4956 domain-containing protein [Bacteroidales bacterium]|nr:DUF4956 domain-containing protein [Bacteroidales bacterium]
MEFFGIDLINVSDFSELVARFLFNMTFVVVIVRFLYYAGTRRKDYLFTYILLAATIFLLCFLLENVKLQLGFALGLFAIFGIIRYRTDAMPIKEMSYLFIIIGLSVINALSNKKVSYAELLFTNFAILAIAFILEKVWLLKHETMKVILYDKIELVKSQNIELLKNDIEQRTGLKINRLEVGNIDFLRDAAKIRIFYFTHDNNVPEEVRSQTDNNSL